MFESSLRSSEHSVWAGFQLAMKGKDRIQSERRIGGSQASRQASRPPGKRGAHMCVIMRFRFFGSIGRIGAALRRTSRRPVLSGSFAFFVRYRTSLRSVRIPVRIKWCVLYLYWDGFFRTHPEPNVTHIVYRLIWASYSICQIIMYEIDHKHVVERCEAPQPVRKYDFLASSTSWISHRYSSINLHIAIRSKCVIDFRNHISHGTACK